MAAALRFGDYLPDTRYYPDRQWHNVLNVLDVEFNEDSSLNVDARVGMFIIGGLSGIFMASTPVDIQIHDTYFIVAHFHYIMVGGAVMAYLGAIHYWWPKMFGRMYEFKKAYLAAILLTTGFKLANDGQDTRAIQHYLGHKNIQHTVRYTELASTRFRDFWKD